MDSFGSLILDILGEIAGGRGGAVNDLPRFTLGMIVWGVLAVSALNARRRNALLRDRLLIAGFIVGFCRELFMLIVAVLGMHNYVSAGTLNLFFPPIDNALTLIAQAVIASAFLHYFVKPSQLSRNFFLIAVPICFLIYIVVAPVWWFAVKANPQIQFVDCWAAWLVHCFGAAFILLAVGMVLRKRTRIRIIVAVSFAMYFGSHFLMLVNLSTDQVWDSVFTPIRNSLELWATPIFGFIYWREQRDSHERLQAEIKQTERLELIGQLAAGVSHDFKNHLQVIMGYAELGQLQRNEPDKVEACLAEISDTVGRSASIVNQLLAFSRQAEVPADLSVNINDVISELTPMLSQLLGQKYFLDFRLIANMPNANIDKTELEQVIMNLVVNARDAQPDGGVIQITTQPHRVIEEHSDKAEDLVGPVQYKSVELRVSDFGIGMSSEQQAHAFEPFYTTKPVGEGTGLGLSTVYGLISKHKGQVSIESELGEGASVSVQLPIADSVEAFTVKHSASNTFGGSEHILLAEDDDSVRNLTTELLSQAGYTVYSAVDGKHAIEIAKKYRSKIDLFLFDVAMPKLNGYLTYETVSKILPKIPVAFVSANVGRVGAEREEYAHLAKPFTRTQLLDYIREQLSDSAVRDNRAGTGPG